MKKLWPVLALVAALLPAPAHAQVFESFPNYIAGLSAASALNGGEAIYALQLGVSKTTNPAQLSTYTLAQYPAYVTGLSPAATLTGTEPIWTFQGAAAVRTTTGAIAAGSPLAAPGTPGDVAVVGPGTRQVQDAAALAASAAVLMPRALGIVPGVDTTTAFTVQNSAGIKTILQVDTVAGTVTLPSLALGTPVGPVCYNAAFQLISGSCGGSPSSGPITGPATVNDFVSVGPGATQLQDVAQTVNTTSLALPRALSVSPGLDTTTAFTVKNTAGTKTILQVDTVGSLVSLPQLGAGTVAGAVCYTATFQLVTGQCGGNLTGSPSVNDFVVVGPSTSQLQDVAALSASQALTLPRALTVKPGIDGAAFAVTNLAGSSTFLAVNTSTGFVSLPQIAAGTPTGFVCVNSANGLVTGACVIATTSVLGAVRVDGTSITVNGSGVISTSAGVITPSTPTSGFTSGDLLGTTGGFVVDAHFAIANIGTVKSLSTGCGNYTNPSTITVSGTIATNLPVDLNGGNAAYAIPLADCGGLVDGVISGVQTYTLPSSSTANWFVYVANNPASTAVLTVSCGTSCSINGGGTSTTLIVGQSTTFTNEGGSPTVAWRAFNTSGGGASLTANNIFSGTNTFNGAITVTEVIGSGRTVSGTTDTLAQTDCGTEVDYTSNSAVTVTIPASITGRCQIAIMQQGTARVAVNGTAVSPATLQSADGYTGTAGLQWSVIGIDIYSAGNAVLTGRGS